MREKKWIDCPVCGSKNSMHPERGVVELCKLQGYPELLITGLSGQFCDVCKDGFWSRRSENKITQSLAEHCARQDAERIVASEIASVQEAAKIMKVSVQGIHKMMNEGRLRSVFVADRRLPIRADLLDKAKDIRRAARA